MKTLKIALGNIEQNPFRDFTINPLENERTDALLLAVKSDKFWSNLQVRKHPKEKGKFQLVYGHHRIKVLEKLGHKDWTFELTDLTDEIMFLRMTDENLHQGGKSPLAMEEAITGAKRILDGYIKKAKTLKDFRSYGGIPPDLEENNFAQLKKTGAGAILVHAYLGGRISMVNIKMFLSAMEPDKKEEREAIRTFSTAEQGRVFTTAARKHKLTPDETTRYATQLKHTSTRSIDAEVGRKKAGEKQWAKMQTERIKASTQRKKDWKARWQATEKMDVIQYVEKYAAVCNAFEEGLDQIAPYLEDINALDPQVASDTIISWKQVAKKLNALLSSLPEEREAKLIN